jgi:serine/threonine-protein kinase
MLEPSPGPVERVVLIDFGFADIEGGHRLTQQGHVVGSLSYLAPERLKGLPGDERSDLYAVGIIMWELLAGRPPFVANDDFELINLHLDQVPHLPAELTGTLTPAIQHVIMQALAKNPDDRAPSAAAMANSLETAMRGVS